MRKLLTPRSGRSNNGLNDLHMEISWVKKLLLLIAMCLGPAPSIGAELSTYPTLNLAKIAGVDSSGNVGLMTPAALLANLSSLPSAPLSQVAGIESNGTTAALASVAALPCSPTIASPALYFNEPSNVIGCSAYVALNKTTLYIYNGGGISFPDGGSYTAAGFNVSTPTNITTTTYNGTQTIPLTVVNQAGSTAAKFISATQNVNGQKAQVIQLSTGSSGASASLDYVLNGSFNDAVCIDWGGSCLVSFFQGGGITSGKITLSNNGTAANPDLILSNCDTGCGFYSPFNASPPAHQIGFVVNGNAVWDYGITSVSNLSFSVPIGLKGYTVSALPTGVLGQEAFVTDATACTYGGTLTGSSTTKCKVWYNGTAWVGG